MHPSDAHEDGSLCTHLHIWHTTQFNFKCKYLNKDLFFRHCVPKKNGYLYAYDRICTTFCSARYTMFTLSRCFEAGSVNGQKNLLNKLVSVPKKYDGS